MTQQNEKRRHFKKTVKATLVVSAICVIASIVWLHNLLTAKPTIKINYLDQYNQLSRPENYREAENACLLYERAFAAFNELPQEQPRGLRDAQRKIGSIPCIWPGDLDPNSLEFVGKWLKSNETALRYARQASQKPYYWVPTNAPNNQLIYLIVPKLNDISKLARALISKAMLDALQNNFDGAFSDLMAAYRISEHLSKDGDIISQACSMTMKSLIFRCTFMILQRTSPNSDILAQFQDDLERHRAQPDSLSFRKEQLRARDTIQWLFTDNGRGNGHLIPREYNALFNLSYKRMSISTKPRNNLGPRNPLKMRFRISTQDVPKAYATIWRTLKHDNRKQTVDKLDALYLLVEKLVPLTPWQIHSQGTTYRRQVLTVVNLEEDIFLGMLLPAIETLILMHHQRICEQSALITVLALVRYEIDKGQHPDTLEDLIDTGYMRKLPMDPYSSKPLIYKKAEDDFMLYSVGADFKDDGGNRGKWYGAAGFDYFFRPVTRPGPRYL